MLQEDGVAHLGQAQDIMIQVDETQDVERLHVVGKDLPYHLVDVFERQIDGRLHEGWQYEGYGAEYTL